MTYHVFYQWVSKKYKEGTVTGNRHDETFETQKECWDLLETVRTNPPMKDMKLSFLIQKEVISIMSKGKLDYTPPRREASP